MTLTDKESDRTYAFQDSIYLLLMTENTCALGFFATIFVVTLALVIINAFDGGTDDNQLSVPSGVSPNVRAAQILGENRKATFLLQSF